jgi:hypothetical protein
MPVLPLVGELFAALRASDISYCHWKSNVDLARSLSGQADLDLLVEVTQRDAFESLVRALRCVPLVHSGPKHIPGIDDIIGFDETSGQLVHLHVHYCIILGEQRVKNHHLPIERWLLSRAQDRDGVRVPRAEDELLILYIRSLLKSDVQACARAWLGRTPHVYPARIHAELRWLAEQTNDAAVLEACRSSGLGALADGLADFLVRLRSGRLTPGYALRQKRVLLGQLRPFQRFPTLVCLGRKAWLRVRYTRLAQVVRPLPKKRLIGRGMYLAIAGADGCGKTTLAADLPKWLGWKVQSRSLYFGQPKRSLIVNGTRKVRRLVLRASAAFGKAGLHSVKRVLAGCASLLDSLLWEHIAHHRRGLDARAGTLTARGQVVFAERFPLRDFWDMDAPMDGPRLLAQVAKGGLSGRLARRELGIYERIRRPDGVIVLSAQLATLRERKPDTALDEHRAKVRAVDALVERGEYDVIDADQPYEQVLLEAKRRVWEKLAPVAAPDRLGLDACAPISPFRPVARESASVSL